MNGLILALALAAGQASAADPTPAATSAEIAAAVAAMEAEMKPGQTFLWRPLLSEMRPARRYARRLGHR